MQARSITRRFLTILCLSGAVLAPAVATPRAQDTSPTFRPSSPPASTAAWREAPDFVALLVPRLYRDASRTFVSSAGLDAVLRAVTAESDSLQAPGSWTPRAENPLDAFGEGATYDRGKLSRLYSSRRPVIARGPRGHDGIVEESWTLISPYPSPDLDRLEPGTLLIVLRVP